MTAKRRTEGASLVEVVVAITVLALIIVPMGTALATTFRLNAAADRTMQAQLAVSGAVETLMAEGIKRGENYTGAFPNVTVGISLIDEDKCYQVTVQDTGQLVTVTTYIRPAPEPEVTS